MSLTRTFTYPSCDGIHTIHAREWLPEGEPRAVLQIVHGIADHVERYDELARFCAERGILVCGEDHLGHGYTGGKGEYGYFADHDGWTLVTQDVRALRQLQGEKYPGVPYVLLGHSMGSFLVRTYLCRYPGTVDAAVLSGTGQEPGYKLVSGHMVASALVTLRGGHYISPMITMLSLGAYNHAFAPNRTRADWISRDEEQVDAYISDRFCAMVPTCCMFRDMMEGLRYIIRPASLKQMDPATPVLFLSGDADPVGAMGKRVKWLAEKFRKAGCEDVTLKLYPGGRHVMFLETNRQEVFADLVDWIESKI